MNFESKILTGIIKGMPEILEAIKRSEIDLDVFVILMKIKDKLVTIDYDKLLNKFKEIRYMDKNNSIITIKI